MAGDSDDSQRGDEVKPIESPKLKDKQDSKENLFEGAQPSDAKYFTQLKSNRQVNQPDRRTFSPPFKVTPTKIQVQFQ
jgi:hypothetical protein